MNLLDISLQSRVIIGISAMVLLFSSFLIAFISNQRKKLQYHKNLQAINAQQQQGLKEQNALLEERVKDRTMELSEQKESLQVALTKLKSSQLLLVQKEKMASLGAVASGIAHEIQNPLNFVNNFAELNSELLEELKELLGKDSLSGPEKLDVEMLVEDVIQNLQKINMHGKRAENIVKNMLLHARSSTGEEELTDINFLVEEYLKLNYHSFRAKEKSFNASLITHYETDLERINIVQQDIGRVFMNIYNNAFYSLNEKAKMEIPGYKPEITVTTKRDRDRVVITTRDNGLGISKKHIDKIFQPFFTTKPTGLGTGLGLSLSYDIIKAHEGELKAESTEGEYAEFIVELKYEV